MSALRVIFFGTAELACPTLSALTQLSVCRLVGVVTQPDRPKGRNLVWQPSPVKRLATRQQLPVLQPERARSELFFAAEPSADFILASAQD